MSSFEEILVGLSSCLAGEQVRYDGGHKHDTFLTGTVARYVTFLPLCPEVGAGMGVPREAVRLVRREGEVRLLETRSGRDWTAPMEEWCHRKLEELASLELCGFILKRASPSCGMERVKLYAGEGGATKTGVGLFARRLREAMPLLPVEEEGRLNDPGLRENFFERVFAYRRLRSLFREGWSVGDLVRFHTAEKMLVLAHDPSAYKELGQVVAAAAGEDRGDVADRYRRLFMGALARKATPGRIANVLLHMLGHLRGRLEGAARQDLDREIHRYRQGLVPLVVPVTLLAHYVRILDVPYLAGQTFLEPHPLELCLRNHG